MQMSHMDEVTDPFVSFKVSFWLRKFIFMMWEDEIDTAWMDINFLS